MFSTIRDFFNVQRYLREVYKNENLLENLSKVFGVECRKDWVGRIYMVVNPILQDMNTGGNMAIYDHNNKMIIERWMALNLELIRNFMADQQMFGLLTYDITKLDEDMNYLLVFKNAYFDDFVSLCKKVLIAIPIISVLIGLGFVIF